MWVYVGIRMLGIVCARTGNLLWEALLANIRESGLGGVPLGSFTDRKWARSVPTFLQQMFDRENIFTAGDGGEGKYMFYDTSHWRRGNVRKENHMDKILQYEVSILSWSWKFPLDIQ